MAKIAKKRSLLDVALIVGDCLWNDGIDAVLTGGGVVSIYTDNQYESYDLDFVTLSTQLEISTSLAKIGFKKTGRYYRHPQSDFYVEFPTPPIAIGNSPVHDFNEIRTKTGYLKLLTPTHCVMDRLAAYYHWNDLQSLDQAVLVAKGHKIDVDQIEKWSEEEGMSEKFKTFQSLVNSNQKS